MPIMPPKGGHVTIPAAVNETYCEVRVSAGQYEQRTPV